MAARTSGGEQYSEELSRAVGSVTTEDRVEDSAERLAALVDALATAAAFAAAYAAAKLGVERTSLVDAISRALTDIHVEEAAAREP